MSDEAQHIFRSGAVTAAGRVLLLIAAFIFVVALLDVATTKHPGEFVIAQVVQFSIATLFLVVGMAASRRWPGWRIITGLVSWFMIAGSIIGVVGEIAKPGLDNPIVAYATRTGYFVCCAVAVAIFAFVLWAKRQERSETAWSNF